jgi:hypothetical protein
LRLKILGSGLTQWIQGHAVMTRRPLIIRRPPNTSGSEKASLKNIMPIAGTIISDRETKGYALLKGVV